MRNFLVPLLTIFFFINNSYSQAQTKNSSSDIYHSIQKLNFLGTALYIAAHPDDENTRLISYLSNEIKAKTAYLSLTRGDGGQNLIGTELRELLGVLRTQELLAARRVDGGEQFFSRANDFGYSKHPKETLEIWDKELVLSDVVWVIRNLKPDVIINRFDHRSPGTTHGHHTSSAILSYEAFDLANDPNYFSSQLKTTTTWQPQRLFFNTSWWFYGSEEKFENADKSKMLSVDIGVYYPNKGISNNEIASLARSQHLCQGFGALNQRGSQKEYIELLKGDLPKNKNNIFDGVNTTWSRVKDGKAIGAILHKVETNFNFKNPSTHLPQLIEAHKLISKNTNTHWKNIKLKEIEAIITAVTGLYLEASAESSSSYPGSTIKINIEAINRSSNNISLTSYSFTNETSTHKNLVLKENEKYNFNHSLKIPPNTVYTSPYWLTEKGTLGAYTVKNQDLIGKPETPRAFNINFLLDYKGYSFTITKPVIHRFSKPDKGELHEPFEILPEVTSTINDKVLIFSTSASKQIPVLIKSGKDDLNGSVSLKIPENWKVSPSKINFNIPKKGGQTTVLFTVTPPSNESEGLIAPKVTSSENKTFWNELIEINYNHIPKQSVLVPSQAKVVRLNIKKVGEHIGYIVGAGDKIPESLEQIGYKVHIINPTTTNKGSLDKYDAIVLGIRAYNVVDQLKYKQSLLLEYVKNGGTLITQYNTSGRSGLDMTKITPYPLTLSRDRVTDENAAVEILAKDHALVNFPNTITKKDFDGWVQERGLYFPNSWSKEYVPILGMNDQGESLKKGSLLVASYGKGSYIYTGLSFFRELPVGVAGAYKLFANMLSINKATINTNTIKK